MNSTKHSRFAFMVIACCATTSIVGCGAPGEDAGETDGALSAPVRDHVFDVNAKSYIAFIPSNQIGSFGNIFSDAALATLVAATNTAYSEDPQTGNPDAEQYRVFGSVRLNVRCTGTTVQMTLSALSTDGGFEGPFRAEVVPLKVRSTVNGTFGFLARGKPNPAVEPAFQSIHARTNSDIWYAVSGHVTCDAAAQAGLFIDKVTSTNFPSVRVWATHASGGRTDAEALLASRAQGKFTGLWSLETPPVSP